MAIDADAAGAAFLIVSRGGNYVVRASLDGNGKLILGAPNVVRFQTGNLPNGVVISKDGRRAYANNEANVSVTAMDLVANTVLTRDIPAGEPPAPGTFEHDVLVGKLPFSPPSVSRIMASLICPSATSCRFTLDLYKHFQLLVGGDIGGFGVGSHFTYSVLGLLGYRFQMFGHAAIAHAGYRDPVAELCHPYGWGSLPLGYDHAWPDPGVDDPVLRQGIRSPLPLGRFG